MESGRAEDGDDTAGFALTALAMRSHFAPSEYSSGSPRRTPGAPTGIVAGAPVALREDELGGLSVLDAMVGDRVLQWADQDDEVPRFTPSAGRHRRARARGDRRHGPARSRRHRPPARGQDHDRGHGREETGSRISVTSRDLLVQCDRRRPDPRGRAGDADQRRAAGTSSAAPPADWDARDGAVEARDPDRAGAGLDVAGEDSNAIGIVAATESEGTSTRVTVAC